MLDRADPNAERFYAELPELTDFHQIADRDRYADAPPSWQLVITDVRGSTAAIEAGRYRDVNALGVASIVALRNAVPDVELPYVFGGDGATLLVPGSRLDACQTALRGVRRLAHEAFGLELRAAHVPIPELRSAGQRVRVARFRASANVRLAMFAGSGFAEAERRVKSSDGPRYEVSAEGDAEANLEGFECRWQPVESQRGQIVSLLVASSSDREEESAQVYREVIHKVEELTARAAAPPITLEGLRMAGLSLGNFSVEARVRSGSGTGEDFTRSARKARKEALIGRVLMGTGQRAGGFDGKAYKRELLENTDFRKFDETLRMVLDLAEHEFEALHGYLEAEHRSGRLVFGVHRSRQALVTCFVRSYRGDHVHFVDGANGGYALAAKELKARLRARAASPRTSL
jgi:hypothetical protein